MTNTGLRHGGALMKGRLCFLGGALATMGAGLLWRARVFPLPRAAEKYGGDLLWALMILFLVRAISPRLSWRISGVAALGFCWAVEFSQLYRAAWIESVRHTRLGHLVLGAVFNWPDLLAYAAGVALGVLLTRSAFRQE
jgi:hypothetical protein